MSAPVILAVFLALKVLQHAVERWLARLNHRYGHDPARQKAAEAVLGISPDDMARSVRYADDRYQFARVASRITLTVTMAFVVLGGLGLVERAAVAAAAAVGGGAVVTGLAFFAVLALLSLLLALPFDYYRTFVIEERHGFNRQTPRGFFLDRIKGLGIGAVLGGLVLAAILWIMDAAGNFWWLFAWAALSAFSILSVWLYPTLLAPLFNRFKPVEDGALKREIDALAARTGFHPKGVSIMDASKRSSHGNAYFTGVFGKKRIVLFDTLVDAMSPREVVAVLAHELGHFKLKHVFWQLIRSVLMTGLTLYLLSLCLPLEEFYRAFGLAGRSHYGALLVFTMWFGLLDFALAPIESYLSRCNEFAADRFAKAHIPTAQDLSTALLKLREKSHAMPISHPLFSAVYHSHPPLIERLTALGTVPGATAGAR